MVDFAKLREQKAHERSIATVDFETRSGCDLKKSGVYRYAEDPSTDILCMAYAFGNDEPSIWWQGDPFPDDLGHHIVQGGEMRAWNAQFERVIWKAIAGPKYGFPAVKDEQWFCTAAEAAAMSLPRQLDKACEVCKLEVRKDKLGYRTMMKMCKPKKCLEDGSFEWNDTPELRAILGSYCKDDVRAERGMFRVTRRLVPKEREIFLLDQRMNDRGMRIDVALVDASQKIVNRVIEDSSAALSVLTSGVVSGPTKVRAMKEWLGVQHDLTAPSLSKKSIVEILEREVSPEVRELLKIRAEAGKESVKKLKAMKRVVCSDDMARGLLLYHGAGTGRWSGKLIQPHNMPRGEVGDAENYIENILLGAYDDIDLLAPPLVAVSGCLRSMLTARPGFDLMAADFSGIECRGVNWLAGQDDVMEMFRKGDAAPKKDKPLYDPYRHLAVKMGKGATVWDISSQDRQAGKAGELGCGFQMGAEKFVTAAWDVYQVRVTLEEARHTVKIYRESHDKVVNLWEDSNNACILAVDSPGSVHTFGPNGCVKVTCRGAYLYIILPIGRPLVYAAPKIVNREMPWSTPAKPAFKPAVCFFGVNPKTRQWQEMYLYGGLIVENVVQAIARDLMAEGMLSLDKSNYRPILSVHDEVVGEVQKGWGDLVEFENILRTPPAWAKDFPIMTEGWRGERYRK